jgi:hypothetical protein
VAATRAAAGLDEARREVLGTADIELPNLGRAEAGPAGHKTRAECRARTEGDFALPFAST